MPSAILLPRVPDCGSVSAALGVASGEGGSQGKDLDCVLPQAQISSTGSTSTCTSRCSGEITGLESELDLNTQV